MSKIKVAYKVLCDVVVEVDAESTGEAREKAGCEIEHFGEAEKKSLSGWRTDYSNEETPQYYVDTTLMVEVYNRN